MGIQGDLTDRTFAFAAQVIRLSRELPNDARGWVVAKQMIRSGTGIGASVREADHALTDADFAHKCSVSRKEASETHYWLELCQHTGLLGGEDMQAAIKEVDELVSILSSIVRKTQHHLRDS